MLTKKSEKICKKYICEICNYVTSDKRDYNKHNLTAKHILLTKSTKSDDEKSDKHICSRCKKIYRSKQGLWSHSKKCKEASYDLTLHNEPTKIEYTPEIIANILELLKRNQETQQNLLLQNNKFMEMNQNVVIHNTSNNIQNIQNNKTVNNFNLTVFLQERCKDALNMSQFIDTLQINPQSVEYTGAHGYVNGITKIFMDGLNQLDIHERPIHCTDLKRETLYIKENNKWEKDTEEKTKFKHALATVVNRNVAQVSHWEKENPRSQIPETEEYEFYFDIVRQSLGGGNHDVTARNNDKILRAIAGKVYLDKKTKEIQ
jgi:hypothetical protein